MRDWGKLFRSCGDSGLYTAGSSADFDQIGKSAVSCGLNYFYMDLKLVTEKHALLQALAVKLGFPPHFGMNWDALKDSLTDMPVDRGCVIGLDNIRGYAQADPGGMRIARNIFKYTAAYWKGQAVSFFVLIRT